MPAKISRIGLSICLAGSGAYSLRYIALKSPRGKAISIAPKEVNNVPVSRGHIPKCLEEKSGVHFVLVTNSMMDTSEKKSPASKIKTETIPIVVRIETTLHKSSNILIIRSVKYLLNLSPLVETKPIGPKNFTYTNGMDYFNKTPVSKRKQDNLGITP